MPGKEEEEGSGPAHVSGTSRAEDVSDDTEEGTKGEAERPYGTVEDDPMKEG